MKKMVYVTIDDWKRFQAWFLQHGITAGQTNKHERLFIIAIAESSSYYAARERLEDLTTESDQEEWRNYLEWLETVMEEWHNQKSDEI